MKKTEMNKFMAWLLGAFPQWKPDQGVAGVWALELPDISAEIAMDAVRNVQRKRPSPFPPGIFQILECFQKSNVETCAEIVFSSFWNRMPLPEAQTKKSQCAFRLATGGDGYGQALTEEKAWHEKRFVAIYNNLTEKEVHQPLQLTGDADPDMQKMFKTIGEKLSLTR